MADNDSGTGSALATPPNVPSSKSSDISIEEIGNEDSEIVESPPEQETLGNDNQAQEEITIADSGDAVVEVKDIKDGEKEEPDHADQNKSKEVENPDSSEDKNVDATEKESASHTSDSVISTVGAAQSVVEEDDDDDEEFEDETVLERLVGLTEMFPSGLTEGVCSLSNNSVSGAKWVYSKGRNVMWIIFSTGALLFLPVMIESERVGFEEMEKARKQQILLGPSSAISSAGQNAPLPPTI